MTAAFERLSSRLDYPMFVVTAAAAGERAGCLVGFSTQGSIDPVRYLVAISQQNHTYRVAMHARRLAVHALSTRALAELFGTQTGDETDKFARCAWHRGPDDVPILDEAAAWFSGPVLERIPLGDHTGFLVAPDSGQADDPVGLLSFADVRDLDAGHDA